jgi:hypothetical protein
MLHNSFLQRLPINNIDKYDDINEWFDMYSSYYPNEDERQEIYTQEGYIENE